MIFFLKNGTTIFQICCMMEKREVNAMSNELLIAIVSISGSLAGSIIGVFGSAKVIEHRLKELEKRSDGFSASFSKFDGRIDNAEKKQEVFEVRLGGVEKRVERLEDRVKA